MTAIAQIDLSLHFLIFELSYLVTKGTHGFGMGGRALLILILL